MEVDTPREPMFRPVKRRKFLRKRPQSGDSDEDVQGHNKIAPSTAEQSSNRQDGGEWTGAQQQTAEKKDRSASSREEEDTGATFAEIMRLRKPYRGRKTGIEFSTDSLKSKSRMGGGGDDPAAGALTTQDMEAERLRAISNRFTPHSGQKVDVDKHMMDYIESQMARRHERNTPSDTNTPKAELDNEAGGLIKGPSGDQYLERQPATLGKLHEIDLGPDAKLRNIARTEAAAKRLVGDESPPPDEEEEAPAKKVRLGKDGKPWRGRKRRNSEDIKRDQLVEEVMRESKLEVYDDESEEEPDEDGQAADDRIAEKFRRDFMEAIQARRRGARARRATKATSNSKQAAKTAAPRGPKLGGSRSARAAMRESQVKAGQK
ncbi:hypothetical protein FQN54_000984 [Arachnomyces sp. PD_36]|nr:hypothetical protein FQN54_000984 [Arachnomyces sp. PD_36]